MIIIIIIIIVFISIYDTAEMQIPTWHTTAAISCKTAFSPSTSCGVMVLWPDIGTP